mmetsp:Transcript_67210/g.108966  ORF Transcript_67210/g.108966 Transcript_67210/m.108966 type:complete len:203 (+) Transcript_67210:30-638(+)
MEECEDLRSAASHAASQRMQQPPESPAQVTDRSSGRVRLKVLDSFDLSRQRQSDRLLVRVQQLLSQHFPALIERLFGDCLDGSTCLGNPQLVFASGEPAINVYEAGGTFEAHEDKQSLTILVALSEPCAFEGGGTAFWSVADCGVSYNFNRVADPETPTCVVRGAAGSALVFGGQVTHGGRRLLTGQRAVLVASFSPKTPLM